jgi:hypothetical protein
MSFSISNHQLFTDETNMTKINIIDSQGNDQFVMEFHVPLMK